MIYTSPDVNLGKVATPRIRLGVAEWLSLVLLTTKPGFPLLKNLLAPWPFEKKGTDATED